MAAPAPGGRAWRRCMALAQRCSSMRELKAAHAVFLAHGLQSNNYAMSKLVEFAALSPAGDLPYAARFLAHSPQPPNAFLLNTLLRAHARGPRPAATALPLLRRLLAAAAADHHSFAFALAAAANAPSVPAGESLHALVVKNGLCSADRFVQTGLLRLYTSDLSLLPLAHQLFDEIAHKDAILFNVLMNGCVRHGFGHKALRLFRQMLISGDERPDLYCVATAISACAQSGAMQQGVWIHDYAKKWRMVDDVFVGTTLVDMYAKCGCIERAVQTFKEMRHRNVFTWAAMVGAFALHGHADEAIDCLSRMQDAGAGVVPDDVLLLNVLTACCHGGLKEEGYIVLRSMKERYGVEPKHEHYSCMVDLLCRAGELEEALELIREMPMRPMASVWGALLSGARMWRTVETAEVAAWELLRLGEDGGDDEEEEEESVYVQLWGVYMAAGRLQEARRVRTMIGEKGVQRKQPGCSAVEVEGVVCEFVAGEEGGEDVHAMLILLHGQISSIRTPHSLLSEAATIIRQQHGVGVYDRKGRDDEAAWGRAGRRQGNGWQWEKMVANS